MIAPNLCLVPMSCNEVLSVLSIFSMILPSSKSWLLNIIVFLLRCVCLCSVFSVLCLFLEVPRVGLRSVVVLSPCHTHKKVLFWSICIR